MKYILSFLLFLISNTYALDISVYHTSDIHGMYMSREAKWDKENSTRTIGGFAVLSNLIKSDKNPYILLDSGDMFQGTPEGNITKGMASIEYMNALGYSAGLVGNHDYDFGEENLKTIIKSAKFPFLGANVYYKKDGENAKTVEYLKPYTIVEKAGKKIAILGIAGVHTKTSTLPSNVKHLDFKDENKETEKYIAEIKSLNPDAIIVMAHIGISWSHSMTKIDPSTYTFSDYEHTTLGVAKAAKSASLVFGGHNHLGLLKGWKLPQSNTVICESYWGLTDVTKAVLSFDDKTGKFKSATCELIPLWTDIYGEDSEILKITNRIREQTSLEMDKVIGNAENEIGFSNETIDSQIGNWMTDIMREYAKADMAFQNSGGIRGYINKGEIKLRDIYQVMPFENTLVTIVMTGEQIEKLISDNLKPDRTSMQISGITVKYEVKDNKVSKIIIEKDGKEIDKNAKFKIATNNYLTSGGSGGRVFSKGSDLKDTMVSVREILINWIKDKKNIFPPETGRFIKIN